MVLINLIFQAPYELPALLVPVGSGALMLILLDCLRSVFEETTSASGENNRKVQRETKQASVKLGCWKLWDTHACSS